MSEQLFLAKAAISAEQRRGRAVVSVLFIGWLILALPLFLYSILKPDASAFTALVHVTRVTLTLTLFYALCVGQGWARWFLAAWCAVSLLVSVTNPITRLDPIGVIFASLYLCAGGMLTFSKSLSSFVSYQHARRAELRCGDRLKILTVVAVVLASSMGTALSLYLRARNRWPESFRNRLTALKVSGAPASLVECNRQYLALGSDSVAVQHFQEAFAAMSKTRPPLMPPQPAVQLQPRYMLPKFAGMAPPDQRTLVVSCLQSNKEALQLLHDGVSFAQCRFPIDLTKGFQALLPHLQPCGRAAHILALESLENLYEGQAKKATGSLIASLHMAEVLRDEPTLTGAAVRDKILTTSCACIQISLGMAQLSARDLSLVSTRMQGVMELNEKGLRTALAVERCMGLSIFQGSDREIADFLEQGRARFGVKLSVEVLRAEGIVQRDADYFIEQMDRIEAAAQSPSLQRMANDLAHITADLEENQRLFASDKRRVNLISCMLLPGVTRTMQAHLWTRALGEVAVAAIGVDRYRQEVGRLPSDLDAVVPRFLASVPKDPHTGQPIGFSLLPSGYAFFSGGKSFLGNDTGQKANTPGITANKSDGIVFRVER
jgi:hypothetical protein